MPPPGDRNGTPFQISMTASVGPSRPVSRPSPLGRPGSGSPGDSPGSCCARRSEADHENDVRWVTADQPGPDRLDAAGVDLGAGFVVVEVAQPNTMYDADPTGHLAIALTGN